MALKTIVKVGKISNLSDARYCSGMTVDMLGFRVIEDQADYVSPQLFTEIRGWFSGPTIVAEVYGIKDDTILPTLIQHYLPDLFELSISDLVKIHSPSSAFILSTTYDEVINSGRLIAPYRTQIAYLLIPDSTAKEKIDELAREFKILLYVTDGASIKSIIENPNVKGIALDGSDEEKPGLKNYGQLANILEKLEAED